ncbi:aminotransferase class I/II-fold pyridoxal phosphate-dependent enzyme [Dyella terrae]|uniref:Aminotransferase class I/II-fold pyridoxal phosphate-dependent enzyme n=3 Tax=Rhodanobacteraceae TaxID=1775411 RepID=A0A4R0Z1U3_9GAMM|nr:aminotransferase class I/II-fold pyridoxal phosphate-dependent enzyme [Dyella terrae]TCI13779.1 aminotransferase class I/II-fold pyridoxal phosphate-dependent enzyme [Dyella soli]
MSAHKRILGKSDLAINGAAPAYKQPLHVGRPNIGPEDVFFARARDIMSSRWLTNNGSMVRELESRLAEYLGVKHCVAMCNGTIALEIAIRATGMTGEVIVPSYTFVATAHALHWQGITPVFADIDPDTHNLDPSSVRNAITSRTSGIIGVHLWGRPAPVDDLQAIADEHNLSLIFDAAHAFGCSYKGTMIGSFGQAEVLSFHATKFYNTFEGGAIVTNSDGLAETARLMRNFGFAGYDNVIHPGTNGKMVEICAAMGLTNLEVVDSVVRKNRDNHQAYAEGFASIPGLRILPFDGSERNNYQYVVLEIARESHLSRDDIIKCLHAENILARKYFWPGCHLMEPYRTLNPTAGQALRNTEDVASRVIVLPTGTMISIEDINTIVSIIRTIAEP